jgi:cysteine desulfurase
MPPIYLDNNATSCVDQEVVAAMAPFFNEHYGNPSSKHGAGMRAAEAVFQARCQVQRMIGADSDSEIIFTSGGTEGDNLALASALDAATASDPGRSEVVTSAVEHPAVLAYCDQLQRTRGTVIHRIGVDIFGRIDLEVFHRVLSPHTAVVSLMLANNETGTLFPVAELAAAARSVGALFHTDAVQAAGRIPIDVRRLGLDLLTLSAHKFHGPKGLGALYVRRGIRIQPLLRGGRHERGRRAGTENVPGIVGCGAAAERAQQRMPEDAERQRHLRDELQAGLLAQVPQAVVVGDPEHRLDNTLCLAFDGIEADDLVTRLSRDGIWISAGSACASGSTEPSHVLRAMRLPFSLARGAVRFSLSRLTTAAEIARVVQVVPNAVAHLARQPELQGVA